MTFICQDCPSNIARECATFQELLEHHFLTHEREFKALSAVALRQGANTHVIGFPNTKTWTNVLGETFHRTDELV